MIGVLPQLSTVREAYPEEKSASVVASRGPLSRGPCGPPRLSVALARRVDLKAALLWRRRARAALTDRACARRNWHGARAHQIRRRMGQPGAALARGRGGGCEVFRAPPSLGRQLEARQRAERRAASESTVVDALLATD